MCIKIVNAVEILKCFAVVVDDASSFFSLYTFTLFDKPRHSSITNTSVSEVKDTCIH